MSKFAEWLLSKRRPVGYTIGGLNILLGVNYALQGEAGLAILWIVLGSFLVWDAYEYK